MGGEFGGGCRVEKHALRTIKSKKLGEGGLASFCPILSGVGDAGRFGARTRYDRVLERALSWSVDKRAVLRTFPQDIDRTSRA